MTVRHIIAGNVECDNKANNPGCSSFRCSCFRPLTLCMMAQCPGLLDSVRQQHKMCAVKDRSVVVALWSTIYTAKLHRWSSLLQLRVALPCSKSLICKNDKNVSSSVYKIGTIGSTMVWDEWSYAGNYIGSPSST